MTECERLIKNGELPASFLEDETRCDYHVESKMKKLWALQIDLVKQLEAVCKRHNLTYFLVGGSCLGAVRHKGVIPWDDDIDVALKRKDYDIFVEKAQEELKEPYFLQTPISDPPFFRLHAVLRNSNGTCISNGDQYLECNNGIQIHVFPLDGYEDNLYCKMFHFITHVRKTFAGKTYNLPNAKDHILKRRLLYYTRFLALPFGLKRYYQELNESCVKMTSKYKRKIGIQYTFFNSLCWTWDAHVFDEAIYVPFEYTTVPIPKGYHEMLTTTYGDYMQFPPVEKRGGRHSFEIEPDVPYKEYCHKKYGVKYN